MTRSPIAPPARRPAVRPALRRALVGALAGILGLGPALLLTSAPAAAAPSHVAIVIAGQGTACVSWHSGITGDEVLNDVRSVRYRNDGLIVQIGGVPSSATADATHFWSYWHDTGSGWRYSSSGASGYQPAAGTVEGWAFDNGDSSPPQPPSASYAAICSDGSSTHSSSPRPSSAPAPRPRSGSGDRVASPGRARTSTAAPKPAARAGTSSAASTSAARSGSRAAASSSAAASSAVSSASSSSTSSAGGPSGPSSTTVHPLTRLAAHHTTGSPLPLILTGVLVVLLGGGAAAVGLRRRTGRT